MSEHGVRIAAVGDLHCTQSSRGELRPLFERAATDADVLILCGDLVDHGLPQEAEVLTGEIAGAGDMPVLAVLGNHDFESGKEDEVKEILTAAGVRVLDGDAWEIGGVGFAGVKGFAGGFEPHALGAWGEAAIKAFVHEAIAESLKLEAALARLQTPQRVALLHYSPIAQTLAGEPAQIFPFLGSSRLEDPLNHFHITAVFHGHAHAGSAEGRTTLDAPVYNVALPLMRRLFPAGPAFRLVEIPTATRDSDGSIAIEYSL